MQPVVPGRRFFHELGQLRLDPSRQRTLVTSCGSSRAVNRLGITGCPRLDTGAPIQSPKRALENESHMRAIWEPVHSPQRTPIMFFSCFPEDARWNSRRHAVDFGVSEYEGSVRVPRHVFRRFIDGAVTPERCLEAYHLQRTRFELTAERKVRNRQLTDDGNVEISGRDLRMGSGVSARSVYRGDRAGS